MEKQLLNFTLVIFLCVFIVFPANAATYDLFVDDSNVTGTEDGSEANPYSTISEALSNAGEDDNVFINDGTYIEHIEVPGGVSLIGESKKGVIIDGGDKGTVVTLNHHSDLKKLTIKGGRTGIKVVPRAGVEVKNVVIKKADKDGVVLEGDSKTRNNDKYKREFSDCTITDNGSKGMYIKKSWMTIEDCEVTDNDEEGIDIRRDVKATIKNNDLKGNGEGNIESKLDDSKITISGNKISGAGASGIALQSYSGDSGDISIEDNTIKNSKAYGIRCLVMNHRPKGGFSSGISLSENSYESNKLGVFSSPCGF